MIYNVVLQSRVTKLVYSTVTGFDGRPLRFTDYRHAEIAANDKNKLSTPFDYEDLVWTVIEEKDD